MEADSSAGEILSQAGDISRPLCVALNGALIATRVSWERAALLFRQRPWLAFVIPFWLTGGTAGLKRRTKDRVALDPASLPYRAELLAGLAQCRAASRKVVLVAKTDVELAEAVARHLGLFSSVLVCDRREGESAATLDAALAAAFPGGFDYIGHAAGDARVLAVATKSYLFGATSAGTAAAASHSALVRVMSRQPSVLRALIKELRLHQWAKNALVFLPVLLVPSLPSASTLARAVLAAVTFSLCASAGYVFNDLLDLEADRMHPAKAKRPFASGALPIFLGFPLFLGLLGLSFSLAFALMPKAFVAMLGLYFVGTLSYSLYLKRLLLLDVLVLAGLYTHRILSGGIATDVRVSAWLLGFSMFLFTSLAFAKRFVELHALTSEEKVKNRGYYRNDLPMITGMGTASGYIAALVFMLYVDSSAVRTSYREPSLLWLVLPVLLFWLGRIWLLAGRGHLQEDPVKFALRDRTSIACGAIVALIAAGARLAPAWLSAVLH
jgi:4-hydroxybenzoate polyprenyltransferase